MTKRSPFKYYKTSPEIIRYALKLRIQYGLSLRQCEDMLAERGIDVSYEAVRYWEKKLGPVFSSEIRKRRIKRGQYSNWKWHIDEVVVNINGVEHYMFRVIDHEGEVLEVFVSTRKNTGAALKVLKKAMGRHGRPDEIVTDKQPAYGAALRRLGSAIKHTTDRRANNLCEVSHQPFRRRERVMKRFRSFASIQRYSSTHAPIHNHFYFERHKTSRARLKLNRSTANAEWNELFAG